MCPDSSQIIRLLRTTLLLLTSAARQHPPGPARGQRRQGAHLYEALSYVWGPTDGRRRIYIQSSRGHSSVGTVGCLDVTRGLHAALSHIRNGLVDHLVWIDAICIDQQNNREKEQ